MDHELRAKIHNRFEIEVIDSKTGAIKEKARAFNVICDKLWDCIVASSSENYATYIQYGSGSGTPSAADTSLFSFAGYVATSSSSSSADYDNGVISSTRYIQLGTTAAVGVTITEVGLAYGTGNGTLVTHAMLQDMNGNPISITKTDTDIINIYSTMFLHWDVNDGNFVLSAGNFTNALLGISTSNLNSAAICIANSNVGMYQSGTGGAISVGTATKVADRVNKKLTYTSPRFGVGAGNAGGMRFVCFGSNLGGVMIQSSQNTWRTQITGESVGVGNGSTVKFKTKFGFPENATVYINGNAVQSGVTVKKLPITTGNMSISNGSSRPGMEQFHLLSISSQSQDGHLIFTPFSEIDNYCARMKGVILYNPLYEGGEGLGSFHCDSSTYSGTVDVSNDLENWITAMSGLTRSDYTFPSQYRGYKYYRFGGGEVSWTSVSESQDGYNIIFNTAPSEGDVITIDYETECIPKDADHVLDVTVTIEFGEYQGA